MHVDGPFRLSPYIQDEGIPEDSLLIVCSVFSPRNSSSVSASMMSLAFVYGDSGPSNDVVCSHYQFATESISSMLCRVLWHLPWLSSCFQIMVRCT